MSQHTCLQQRYLERFQQLDSLLATQRPYWQLQAFDCADYPTSWSEALIASLESISDEALAPLEQGSPLPALAEHFPALHALSDEALYPPAPQQPQETPFWLSRGMKGRKAEQVQRFSQATRNYGLPFVEWCAGKGHLGKLLSFHHQQPVLSLEWQQSLCEAGEQVAQQLQLPQQFIEADVLAEGSEQHLKPKQHAVALHACGELHLQLLRKGVEREVAALSVCPCCYHLIPAQNYQPLSREAKASSLALSKTDLRLAVQQSATGGARVQRLRHTEVTWRLAYDSLQQQLSGNNQYRPLPSINKQWFTQEDGFEKFCQWAADYHQLDLPDSLDLGEFLQMGQQHYRLTRRIELVRRCFSRAIEQWLILDRALFLLQQGYQVEIQLLFEQNLSPRNFLIQARRA
ncbi:methyltransferase [Aliagarivorans marinus]|uniref:methyltransferase n=1 Tax=Aliagarivorans marinus TaxID=561965 RepID=UPI00042489B2|nr:methyltransferase [Aliagarivorans marinus]